MCRALAHWGLSRQKQTNNILSSLPTNVCVKFCHLHSLAVSMIRLGIKKNSETLKNIEESEISDK
jgi:hypothetical protein